MHDVLSVTVYYTVHDFAFSCFLGGSYVSYVSDIHLQINLFLEVGILYNYCMH